jgi:hypothetical protein
MLNKNSLFTALLILTIVFTSCTDDKKFAISKENVGKVNANTTVTDLYKIFEKDSIIKNLSEGSLGSNFFQDNDEYLIYEKGGKHLLTIVPKEQLDSASTIKNIEIFDNRFKTESGISLASTFAEIRANIKVDKIESSLKSATLFINELNATFVIANEEMGLKDFSNQKVVEEQIPDLAKMKSFVVWFN